MKVYKLAKGWAIFIYITTPILIALFIWPFTIPFTGPKTDMQTFWILGPISIAVILFMIIALIETVKGKFVIDKDKVFTVGAFGERVLMFNEIKGYRITDNYLFIEPKSKNQKKIKISTYFAKTNEIILWLSDNYSDLDIAQANLEKEEILSNDDFGWTKEQREEKLAKAQKAANILNWTGGILGAWALFLPNPYPYAVTLSIVFPIICLMALKYFNGLIRIDERKDTAYPTILIAILATSMGVCLRGLLDYNIFDHSKIWHPALLITLAYMTVLAFRNKELKFNKSRDYFTMLVVSLVIFGYAYGTLVTLNCMYDKSVPQQYHATVLDKRTSSGKTTTYYLELTPWGQQKSGDDVSVSEHLYHRLNKNSKVNIYYMNGLFDIPWFEVTE